MKEPIRALDDPMRALQAEMEAKALADYKAHEGRVLLVSTLTGYVGESGQAVTVHCDPPARVRVNRGIDKRRKSEDLRHWCDNWLDPYWDVTLIERHPALEDARGLWVFGTAYCTDGRTEPCSEWQLESTTLLQRVADGVRRITGGAA